MHEQRKQEHLRICLDDDVRSGVTNRLERYRLVHHALPEMALDGVSTATTFLGRGLGAPLLISAMTGGTSEARDINRRLATAAQELGVAMGLGSQRAALEDPSLMRTYQVRDVAPDVLLLANLGAVQLNYGYGVDHCRRAVEAVGADALVLHLNPLQEALQPGGNTDFGGLLERIAAVCRGLEVPVIVKEVGWGLSAEVAARLCDAGVAALDVAGAGGTSWSEVERLRSAPGADDAGWAAVATAFSGWGIPTAEALVAVRAACPELPVVASGGVRDGVEVALCAGLGADIVGLAAALLGPASRSLDELVQVLETIIQQLRVAMFCCGARTLRDLRGRITSPVRLA